ncbi:MAG: hypothetical protein QOI47_1739 [Actinomycetota bacterium]|nr:hypothetical protein [Actinomycetota bacterium]
MAVRVQFHVGPVPSDIVSIWIDNSRRLIDAVRRHPAQVSITMREELLDLCDALLDIWDAHAAANVSFDWSTETDTDQVVFVVRQWLEISSLTDDELARIGCTWAPEVTRPFFDALVAGALEALEAADAEGDELMAKLRGDA